MSRLHFPLSAVTAAVTAALLSTTAQAQSVLEEVVVVAQKREQNLQDVPIAITAFTGAQMDAGGERKLRYRQFCAGRAHLG